MVESEHEALGIRYVTDPDVYDPSDDSLLLADAITSLPRGRLLEVGTGSGLVALAAARVGHEVVATDTNPAALALARANARRNGLQVHLVRADLLRGLRLDRFDTVVFNPPYLPTAAHERLSEPINAALDGGPDGLRVLRRFLSLLSPPGPRVVLITSSLQDAQGLEAAVRERGFRITVLREVGVGLMERLRVVEL